MSDMLKSSILPANEAALESTYQTTISQGNRLVELLRNSPGGSQDSTIAEEANDKVELLSNLHEEIQPLLARASAEREVDELFEEILMENAFGDLSEGTPDAVLSSQVNGAKQQLVGMEEQAVVMEMDEQSPSECNQEESIGDVYSVSQSFEFLEQETDKVMFVV